MTISLTPPRAIIADLLEQRKRQLRAAIAPEAHVAYLSRADLATVRRWWQDCSGEPGVSYLLGMTLTEVPA